jgi:8-oxo-dGTP pyrophosphatase MutT (NUDIX family)
VARLTGTDKPGATRKGRTTRATSCGGVVLRTEDGAPQLCIGMRRRERSGASWMLPKGTPAGNETVEQTALREVAEETGLEVRIVAPVGAIDYFFTQDGERIHKTVHYFLMEPTGGDLDGHDHEFDEVRWFPLPEALSLLSFLTERQLVEQAVSLAGL